MAYINMATDISKKRKKKYKKRKVSPIFISKTKFERTKNKTKEKEKFDPKNTRFKMMWDKNKYMT